MTNITVAIEDYIPTLDDTDIDDLVNFSVELFCAENLSEEINND